MLARSTRPGKQLQIDFGERRVTIGDEKVKVYLFVATLGYSRRLYVRAFRNERQESWFAGVERAFRHFGEVTEEVLLAEQMTIRLARDHGFADSTRQSPMWHYRTCRAACRQRSSTQAI